MSRCEYLTERMWDKIGPLLPDLPKNPKGGSPRIDNRRCLEGILWVLKTGARWRDLPEEYPSPSTCWRRMCKWAEDGVWERIKEVILGELYAKGRLDWREAFLDGSFAPTKKGATESGKPSGARVRSG